MSEQPLSYKSVSCSFYDRLEALATRRTPCTLLYHDNGEQLVEGVIADLFTRDGAEFLKLHTGLEIRLDRILSINGEPVSYSC